MYTLAIASNDIDQFAWVGSFSVGLPEFPDVTVRFPPLPNAQQFRGSNFTRSIDRDKFLVLLPD